MGVRRKGRCAGREARLWDATNQVVAEKRNSLEHSVLRRAQRGALRLRAAELPKGTALPIVERRLHVPFGRYLAAFRAGGRKAWQLGGELVEEARDGPV